MKRSRIFTCEEMIEANEWHRIAIGLTRDGSL
jgi:hypothetical protein